MPHALLECEPALIVILQFFNIVDITTMRQANLHFKAHIKYTAASYGYLSCSNDNRVHQLVPNLTMFRLLGRFTGVRHLRCHGRVNIVEIMKYLELAPDTVVELDIEEGNIDLIKLFKQKHLTKAALIQRQQEASHKGVWHSASLRGLGLTDFRKHLIDLEI